MIEALLLKHSNFDAYFIGLEGKKLIIFGHHQPKTTTVLVTDVSIQKMTHADMGFPVFIRIFPLLSLPNSILATSTATFVVSNNVNKTATIY